MTKGNKPTKKQATALELIRQGMKPRKAMQKAGYSKLSSTHPRENLLQAVGARSIIEKYKDAYTRVGITQDYMANKTKEWLEAHKVKSSMTEPDKIVPDYETQLKAAEMVRKDWGMEEKSVLNQLNVGGDIGITFIQDDQSET
jgi:hypothetical protein